MMNMLPLLITAAVIALLGWLLAHLWIRLNGPRALGNILLFLLGIVIAWIGGVTVGIWGIGYFFLLVLPVFVMPSLVFLNLQIPWILNLLISTLAFTSISGIAVKVSLYDHWRHFGDTHASAIARLWECIAWIGGSMFGIALIVILICLGVRRWKQYREGW